MVSKQAKEHGVKKQPKTIDVDVLGEALESCAIAKPEDVVDIDRDDYSNPQLCAEYAQEIYQYMHKLEVITKGRSLLVVLITKAQCFASNYKRTLKLK